MVMSRPQVSAYIVDQNRRQARSLTVTVKNHPIITVHAWINPYSFSYIFEARFATGQNEIEFETKDE